MSATPAPSRNSRQVLAASLLVGALSCGIALAVRQWRARAHSPRKPESVRPGINAPFAAEGEGAVFLQRFEIESREIFVKSPLVLAALQVTPGMRVADLGAGTGLFLEQLARAVTGQGSATAASATAASGGQVFALDPFPKFTRHMRARLAELALTQPTLAAAVHVQQSSHFSLQPPCPSTGVALGDVAAEPAADRAATARIPDASLDLVLCTDSYHHFEHPLPLIASVHQALKPNGRFAVLDFIREEGYSSEWVMGHVRAGQSVVRSEIESQGFEFVEDLREQVGLQENYLMLFTKK